MQKRVFSQDINRKHSKPGDFALNPSFLGRGFEELGIVNVQMNFVGLNNVIHT